MKLRILLPLLLVALLSSLAYAQKKPKVGLRASVTGHSVTLFWTASTSAATDPTLGYNVYRSTTPGAEAAPALNGAALQAVNCPTSGPCTYVDATATAEGTKYYYVLTADSPTRTESVHSTEASATIPVSSAPAPPTGVTVTAQ